MTEFREEEIERKVAELKDSEQPLYLAAQQILEKEQLVDQALQITSDPLLGSELSTQTRAKSIEGHKGFFGGSRWRWIRILPLPLMFTGVCLWFNHRLEGLRVEQATTLTQIQEQRPGELSQQQLLDNYIREISELVKQEDPDRGKIADDLTHATLRSLNSDHQSRLVIFLSQSGLLSMNGDSYIDLGLTNLSGTDLRDVNLSRSNLFNVNLTNASLVDAEIEESYLILANLSGADLSHANLFDSYLPESNLGGANLNNSNLTRAKLQGANLIRANLNGAKLERANLSRSHLDHANLSGALLHNARMFETSLHYTDMRNSFLAGTELTTDSLSDAILEGAYYTDELTDPDVCKLLENGRQDHIVTTCPTLFPEGFDPQAARMRLVRTSADLHLPSWSY